jgi:tetratricopeptide (TPR) repeat protein
MDRARNGLAMACLSIAILAAATAGGQGFGTAKERVTLERKLPALVSLPGTTIKVKVTGHDDQSDLANDLQALLETELLKNDPRLTAEDRNPSAVVTCQITNYSHPKPTVTARQSYGANGGAQNSQTYTRVTGALSVSFQARSAGGEMLGSDNVTVNYDQEFDSSGNATSQGVKGSVTSAWKRVVGGKSGEDFNPPTDSELRSHLLDEAVRRIAEHIVNTSEIVEVYLARQKGALDEGDKLAEAGLWQRALETFETARPLPKQADDAYRLYNIGVAYEALAYKAEDAKSAMKFLDEAAINYGKAIDARPGEKYFREPQRRIETAIAHYKKLEDRENQKAEAAAAKAAASENPPAPPPPVAKMATPAKALTNAQVIAMVNSGVDDDTVAQTIRAAKAVNFDLTAAGQQDLSGNGVSAPVLAAMKARAARKPAAAKPAAATPATAK